MIEKIINIAYRISKVIIALCLVLLLFLCWRVFVADRFIIPTGSMEPTLEAGDRILVNKLIFGARIYTDYDFKDAMELKCFRIKGFRKIRRNDIIVFNYPKHRDSDSGKRMISFKINHVYAKRCVAVPGDSIGVVGGYWRNNNYNEILGVLENQDALAAISEEELPAKVRASFQPYSSDHEWTIKNFGPVYVPGKGDVIAVNDTTKAIYEAIFKYENASATATEHTFIHDYYFMAGDNVLDSGDSRYWGFVPDDYMVGIVKVVLFHRNQVTGKRSYCKFKFL